jgi:hypothetical protein
MSRPFWGTVVVALLIGGIFTLEVRHHSKFGHWFAYGWHIDVLSDELENKRLGISHVQYAAVTNFSVVPDSVEACVPSDSRGRAIPVSPSQIQVPLGIGWRTVHPEWPLKCLEGRIVRRRLWPLMSFYTEPKIVAYEGKIGDWVRLVAFSAFDNSPEKRRAFFSMPFQLVEESPEQCPKGLCINVRSIELCESIGVRDFAASPAPCRKVEGWRDRPGSPHPTMLDMLVEIQNVGPSTDVIALTTMDSLIAPTSQYGIADLDKLPTSVSWSGPGPDDEVKLTNIKWLQRGETRFQRIPGFDLQPLINFFGEDPATLWPWLVRANVRIESRNGDRLATASVTLPLTHLIED